MVAQTTAQTNTPKFGWSPKQMFLWWITPRATERDERFREGALRVSALLLLLSLTFYTPLGLYIALEGATKQPELLPSRIGIIFFSFIFVGGAFLLIQKNYKITAAWLLIGVWVATFLLTTRTNGLWMNLSIVFLGIILLYGNLILPRRQIPYLWAVNLISIILAVALSPHTPPENFEESMLIQPVTTLSVSITFVVVISTLLYVLRNELVSRLQELRGFVKELDNRVKERTAQLEERGKELEIARQKAEEANVIKTKFLANMSHELRTPLNAILNFTAFVADGIMGDVNEEQEDALRQSISSGKHLLALINDILDVTKIEAGLMDLFIQQIDFNEVLGAVVAIGKGLSKDKPIDLVTEIQDKMPTSYGDKRRMRQVFLNIVSNAFKFTREGSVIIEAHATDSHIHVKITDTGIGIAPENHDLVFESFKQVQHESLEVVGTGLGMPISKYFVESHHGKIWFESQVGVGTTFFVELPILTEEQANALRLEVV